MPTKAEILAQLQKEILPLQGYKPLPHAAMEDVGLGAISQAFPNQHFPLAATHEFFCHSPEEAAASYGFITGILSTLMRNAGLSLWVGSVADVFSPALKSFGVDPQNVVFVPLEKEKDVLWAVEEALKCEGLSAVLGDISEISFTASRRLQLAVEESKVSGFFIRRNPRNLSTACLTRWHIKPLLSTSGDRMPGVGFPRWNVQLLKVRNGKPGSWQIEWKGDRFQPVYKRQAIIRELERKAG